MVCHHSENGVPMLWREGIARWTHPIHNDCAPSCVEKGDSLRLKIFMIASYLMSTRGLTGIRIWQVSIHGCHSIRDTRVLRRWQVWLWM